MTVLTFPSNPENGDTYTAPNGTLYTYDGIKWIVTTTTITGEQSINFVKDTVAQMFEDIGLNYDTETNTVTGSANTDRLVNGAHEFTLTAQGTVELDGDPFTGSGGNANTGDLTFNASTMRAPNNTTLNVNAYSGSNVIAGVDLNPSTFDATLKSVWAVTNTYGTGYWTTAEWTSNGDDVNGTVTITGSTALFNLFTKEFQYASNIMVSINGSPAMAMASRGYTYPDGVTIGTTDGFSLDPATVTEMTITFDTVAKFKANANGQGLRMDGGEGSITLDTMYDTNINSDYIYLTSKTLQGSGVVVRTDYSGFGQGKEWQFNSDGTLSLPDNGTLQQGQTRTRSKSGSFNISTPTVIWSSSADWISSAKLVIQIECNENGDGTGWHSQACEAIVASRGWSNGGAGVGEPQMTVYGVVHTSVDPLMTFTIQRNATTKVFELLATATLTAAGTNAYYSVSSTEMTTWD